LTANLKVMVVSRSMNVSWSRFSGFVIMTPNVVKVILQMKNCNENDAAQFSKLSVFIRLISFICLLIETFGLDFHCSSSNEEGN